jgi:hypothetical protein
VQVVVVAAGGNLNLTINCPTGQVAVSAGTIFNPSNITLVDNAPIPADCDPRFCVGSPHGAPTGWLFGGVAVAADTFEGFVVCSP